MSPRDLMKNVRNSEVNFRDTSVFIASKKRNNVEFVKPRNFLIMGITV